MNSHVDGLLLPSELTAPNLWSRGWQTVCAGTSRAVVAWRAGRQARAAQMYERAEWDIRRQEKKYIRAGDHQHLERMEREWDRRDVSSLTGWEWR